MSYCGVKVKENHNISLVQLGREFNKRKKQQFSGVPLRKPEIEYYAAFHN